MPSFLSRTHPLALLCLLLPGLALAHAHLKSADPEPDSTLTQAPQRLSLTFSEGIETTLSKVELRRVDAQGATAIATGPATSADEARTLIIPLSTTLQPGRYQVTWRVLAKDGHKTHGDYRFTLN